MKADKSASIGSRSAAWESASLPQALLTVGAVITGCLLVGLGAQVRVLVPGTDVPATLQLLAVLLTGLMLSPSAAAAAMLLYLLCGAAGLPVFVPGSAGMAGPTGGYLAGFVPAAFMVSLTKGTRSPGLLRCALAAALGVVVVFALGVGWRVAFAYLAGLPDGSVVQAAVTGSAPFALKTAVEVFLAATLVSVAGNRGRFFQR